jgi:excisionase family DNA binding protein
MLAAMSDTARETITLREAAGRLGISRTTAQRLAKRGEFPCQLPRSVHQYLVDARAFDDYVKVQAAPERPGEPLMRFFAYDHLPVHLRAVSQPFGELAETIVATLPRSAERTVSLRKLLEAKDAGVRAALTDPVVDART